MENTSKYVFEDYSRSNRPRTTKMALGNIDFLKIFYLYYTSAINYNSYSVV